MGAAVEAERVQIEDASDAAEGQALAVLLAVAVAAVV
jgi:hypothetical protein